MKEISYVLAYVVWFSTLIPLTILWIKRKNLNDAYIAVLWVLVGIFAAETFSFLTNQLYGQNRFSTHITMVLLTIPPLWFFHTVFKSPRFSRFLLYAGFGYVMLHGVDIFYTAGIYNYNWLSRAYTSVLFTYCGMYYLLRMYRAPSSYSMSDQPLYWFCLAIAVTAGGVFMLDIGQKLFDPALEKNWPYLLYIHFIRLCLLILSRILFTIGVFKIPSNRTI